MRFTIFFEHGLFITHSLHPECVIEVILLEQEALWTEVAEIDSLFDFFILKKETGNDLYMLIVLESENVEEEEVPGYRHTLRRAWKWFLHRYLLGGEYLPGKPRHIQYTSDEAEENGQRANWATGAMNL